MTAPIPDLTEQRFVLPPDARVLDVADLSQRLRSRIGPVEVGYAVVTRPGYRVAAQLVPGPLAHLIHEFRQPSLMTDAVLRFARAHSQDPFDTLELAFDALATLVETRILVPEGSPDAAAPVPTMGAGQEFAGFEVEALVRSLDDSEVYRARSSDGSQVALKVARDGRSRSAEMLAHEATILERLGGLGTPALLDHGPWEHRAYLAMQWCAGTSVGIAAQRARAADDRPRLHALVTGLLEAYGGLHARGVLHGDVHPGNCLVQDDGQIVLLDFGNARVIGAMAAPMDAGRTGIAHFHDPEMARALLAGHVPPSASPASEQYAIGVLAYILLTGLHPIDSPAVTAELLDRIVNRPHRPFAARGVAAWPGAERVLARALAKRPEDRYPDVAAFAGAFAQAERPPATWAPWSPGVTRAFDHQVRTALRLDTVDAERSRLAWFALRAAMVAADAELLGAADVIAAGLGPNWADQAIVAHVARARFDPRTQSDAVAAFLAAAAGNDRSQTEQARILRVAGEMLRDPSPGVDREDLVRWAREQVSRVVSGPPPPDGATVRAEDVALLRGALSLVASGAVVASNELRDRVNAVAGGDGDVWLWALAHEIFGDQRYASLAVQSDLPESQHERVLALLALHQVTGDPEWVRAARDEVEIGHRSGCAAVDVALLVAETSAPEAAILPPFAAA